MAMMVLPSQFDEALRIPRSIWSNLFWQEGERERVLMQIPQKRVTKLINHHKVVAFPPQPQVRRPLGAAVKGPKAFSREVDPGSRQENASKQESGTAAGPLLAHAQTSFRWKLT
jgi:hypothetical protein